MARRWSRLWRDPELAVPAALVGIYVILHLATVTDYGLTWDCNELYIGDCNLHYYLSFDPALLDYGNGPSFAVYDRPDHPDLRALTLDAYRNATGTKAWEVWPFGCTMSSLSKYIFYAWLGWLDPIDAHHLVIVLFGALLLAATLAFARRPCGLWGSVVAGLCVVAHPRFWAHLHNNFKDPPSVLFYAAVIYAFYLGIVQPRWRWLVASAVLWGFGMATKGNALMLPFVLGPWFAAMMIARWRKGERLLDRGQVIALAAYPFIGLVVTVLLWPYLLADFPAHLGAYFQSLVHRGFDPAHTTPGWNWLPLTNAVVTMPMPMLLLVATGLGRMVYVTRSERRLDPLHGLLLLWLVVPVLRVTLPGASDFDVIRHWLEFIPAAAIIAGIGAAWLLERAAAAVQLRWGGAAAARQTWRGVAVVAWFVPVFVWMVANHPFELAFYNSLAGGLKGAQAHGLPQATDYWGSSYRQGEEWLNAHAEPDSLVAVGVAEHVVAYTATNWLRPDLRFYYNARRPAAELNADFQAYPGHVYFMYITRRDSYTPFVTAVDRTMTPVHDITVDGAPILRIYRLK